MNQGDTLALMEARKPSLCLLASLGAALALAGCEELVETASSPAADKSVQVDIGRLTELIEEAHWQSNCVFRAEYAKPIGEEFFPDVLQAHENAMEALHAEEDRLASLGVEVGHEGKLTSDAFDEYLAFLLGFVSEKDKVTDDLSIMSRSAKMGRIALDIDRLKASDIFSGEYKEQLTK